MKISSAQSDKVSFGHAVALWKKRYEIDQKKFIL